MDMIKFKQKIKLKSKVWQYPGMAGWHFLGIAKIESKKLREKYAKNHKGWGSLPVNVTVGKTTWQTSIFYDTKSTTYLLPLKAKVRKVEEIFAGDEVTFMIQIKV